MTVVQITFSLVCLAASVVTNSPGENQLKWKKHYDTTKQSAQTAKRPMLLVLENPTNTKGQIDETKLTDKERKILTHEKFELCRVDVNTEYGKRVAQAFGARVFPYTVVTDDSSKRIVFRKPGPMSEQDWTLALAKSTRQSDSPAAAAAVTTQPVSPHIGNPTSQPQAWTHFSAPANGVFVIPQAAPSACFT